MNLVLFDFNLQRGELGARIRGFEQKIEIGSCDRGKITIIGWLMKLESRDAGNYMDQILPGSASLSDYLDSELLPQAKYFACLCTIAVPH